MKQTAAEAFAPLLQRLNALRAVEAGLAKPDDPAKSCPQCGNGLYCKRDRHSSKKAERDVFVILHHRCAEPCPLRFETLAKGFSEDEAWQKLNPPHE